MVEPEPPQRLLGLRSVHLNVDNAGSLTEQEPDVHAVIEMIKPARDD